MEEKGQPADRLVCWGSRISYYFLIFVSSAAVLIAALYFDFLK